MRSPVGTLAPEPASPKVREVLLPGAVTVLITIGAGYYLLVMRKKK